VLNHIDWYLVELERRLRRRRSAQATTDFLVETREHLEERTRELMAKGLDRVSAVKASLSDFGDPDSVVAAYSGATGLSRQVLLVSTVLTSLIAVAFVGLICLWIGNTVTFVNGSFTIVLALPWIVAALVLGLALRTRLWIAVPVCLSTIAAALLGGVWAASNVQLVANGGETYAVSAGAVGRQLEARRQWVREFDRDFVRIQSWRGARNAPQSDALLKVLIGPECLAPARTAWNYHARLLPSSKLGSDGLEEYGPRPSVIVALIPTGNFKVAKQMWREEVDRYAAELKAKRKAVDVEIASLESPLEATWVQRWQRVGLAPVSFSLFGSLVLLTLNGLAVGFVDIRRARRTVMWKRLVG